MVVLTYSVHVAICESISRSPASVSPYSNANTVSSMNGTRSHELSSSQPLTSRPLNRISEYSSVMVGSRQSSYPARLNPSAPATASSKLILAPGSCCHIKPVCSSVTVPSPLST